MTLAGVAELLRRAQRALARRRGQEPRDQALRRGDEMKIAVGHVVRADRSVGRSQVRNRWPSILTFSSVTPPALIRSCRCWVKLVERAKLLRAWKRMP